MADCSWLGPVAGLFGTTAAAALGYYQWRKVNRQRQESEFYAKRAERLEILIQRLQGVQLLSRSRSVSYKQIQDQVRSLNEFLIENRLWLEAEDERLARQYVDALLAIHIAMSTATTTDLDVYVATDVGPYSDSVAGEFRHLGAVQQALIERAREAIQRKST